MAKVSVFWFRRDLRLSDNTALFQALQGKSPVLPVFIFDINILEQLDNRADRRVEFIHDVLNGIHETLIKRGSGLFVFYGTPADAFRHLMKEYEITAVYTNHDYEPYARERDDNIRRLLGSIPFHTFKDQVIFEKDEVVKADGTPYTVFTPYSRKWKEHLLEHPIPNYPSEKKMDNFFKQPPLPFPSLEALGFTRVNKPFPPGRVDEDVLKHYKEDRNYPGIKGTSRLGVHLRFGTISIRRLLAKAASISETFVNELIWRDFYHMILWHFSYVAQRAFRPAYDRIEWRYDEPGFEKWCIGQTGYPMVDAGMRELNETGFMHNRVRMITASFLCKHLLIDWRLGEAYFAEKLLDYDLASNNGGWQWAAGSGCDAAPYFRIFNPTLQMKKFDPDFSYVKKWAPEFQEFSYPAPVVEHDFARKRCIEVYSRGLNEK